MFAIVLADSDYKPFGNDSTGLQAVARSQLTGEESEKWLPDLFAAGKPSIDAVNQGVAAAIQYWSSQTSDNSDVLKNINDVRGALNDFRSAEKTLQDKQALAGKITKFAEYQNFIGEWKTQFATLEKSRDRAVAAWSVASSGKDVQIAELYKNQRDKLPANLARCI